MIARITQLAAWALCAASSAALALTPPKDLDYSRTVNEPGFVFIPRREIDRGPVYFTSFTEKVFPPTPYGDLVSIRVELTPTAVEDGSYKRTIAHPRQDDLSSRLPRESTACSISKEALARFAHLPAEIQPRVVGGSYPQLCIAVFRMLPEEVDGFNTFLSTRLVLGIDYDVPLCEPSSPVVTTGAFWTALNSELKAKGIGEQQGFRSTLPLWRAVGEAWSLASKKPELIPGEKDAEVLEAFLDKFDFNAGAKTLSEEEQILSSSTTLCIMKALKVTRGQL